MEDPKKPKKVEVPGTNESLVDTEKTDEMEEFAGEKTIMPGEEVKIESEPEIEPESEKEVVSQVKPWHKIEMSEDEEGNLFFTFPEVPMLKTVNKKVSLIVFFSILTILILLYLAGSFSEKFSENLQAVKGIGKSVFEVNENIKEIDSSLTKKLKNFQNAVSTDFEDLKKEISSVKSGINMVQLVQDDLAENQKLIYKKIKSGNFRIGKVEKKVDILIERTDPLAVEEVPAETPAEEKSEFKKPEESKMDDARKTPKVKPTKKVGKTMPEKQIVKKPVTIVIGVDKKVSKSSESVTKVTVRKIKKK